MTLNCYKLEFSANFAWFRRFGRQQRLHEWRYARIFSGRYFLRCTDHVVIAGRPSARVYIYNQNSLQLNSWRLDFFARGLPTRTAVTRLPLRQLGFLVINRSLRLYSVAVYYTYAPNKTTPLYTSTVFNSVCFKQQKAGKTGRPSRFQKK